MTLWDSLLRTTGGALELSDTKSDFINIGFEWKNGRSKMKKKDETLSISVQNHLGILQNVHQLNPTDARETLGVFQAAHGSEEAQVNKLKKKAKDWVGNIKQSALRRDEVRCAVDTTIGRTLQYPLQATAMSTKQCKDIDKVFLAGALPKTGIVRTAPRDLVFAPDTILGFNFVDTDRKQLAEHVMKILDHGSEETLTGVLIRNLCKGTSIECGRGGNVWDLKPSESP